MKLLNQKQQLPKNYGAPSNSQIFCQLLLLIEQFHWCGEYLCDQCLRYGYLAEALMLPWPWHYILYANQEILCPACRQARPMGSPIPSAFFHLLVRISIMQNLLDFFCPLPLLLWHLLSMHRDFVETIQNNVEIWRYHNTHRLQFCRYIPFLPKLV